MMDFLNKKTILLTSLCVFLIPTVMGILFGDVNFQNDEVHLYLYTRDNPSNPEIATSSKEITNFKHLNSSHRSVMFIDEFYDCSHKYPIDTTIKNAYLKMDAYNFITVKWASDKNLHRFQRQIDPYVGNRVADFIYEMDKMQMMPLSKLHIIGFGRGAHIAANASEHLKNTAIKKIMRITGLNPVHVSPIKILSGTGKLGQSSAKYVDLIFTAKKFSFGNEGPIGHADFYVNYAQNQASCDKDICCKHNYAWKYYMDTIYEPHKYPVQRCIFFTKRMRCRLVANQYMGIASNSSEPGVFHVEIADGLMGTQQH